MKVLTRAMLRRFAALFAFAALLIPGMSAVAQQTDALRAAGSRLRIFAGTAAAPQHFSDVQYRHVLGSQYNIVEPENVMKWRWTEPADGVFDFSLGDDLVAFANRHKMRVRGHNLLWHVGNPAWLVDGHWTPSSLRLIMRKHIFTEVRHYRGQVYAWDVVNEAIDGRGRVRHNLWYDEPGIGLGGKGTAYIAQAFRWAHMADPGALLFYNDYGAEGFNAKSDAIYRMVKRFKRNGVPIDGVGFQCHLRPNAAGLRTMASNLARFARLGVQVQITELDVFVRVDAKGKPLQRGAYRRAAEIYRTVARLCVRQPACRLFQTWGFTTKYMWLDPRIRGRFTKVFPYDRDYHQTPAYRAVLQVFENAAEAGEVIAKRRTIEDAALQNR
jgi:endo-1,4-beta-xylanase